MCEGSVGINSMRRCRQNTQVDKPEDATVVDLQEPVSLSFALRYLNSFAKASPLSSQVQKSLSCAFSVLARMLITMGVAEVILLESIPCMEVPFAGTSLCHFERGTQESCCTQ